MALKGAVLPLLLFLPLECRVAWVEWNSVVGVLLPVIVAIVLGIASVIGLWLLLLLVLLLLVLLLWLLLLLMCGELTLDGARIHYGLRRVWHHSTLLLAACFVAAEVALVHKGKVAVFASEGPITTVFLLMLTQLSWVNEGRRALVTLVGSVLRVRGHQHSLLLYLLLLLLLHLLLCLLLMVLLVMLLLLVLMLVMVLMMLLLLLLLQVLL